MNRLNETLLLIRNCVSTLSVICGRSGGLHSPGPAWKKTKSINFFPFSFGFGDDNVFVFALFHDVAIEHRKI